MVVCLVKGCNSSSYKNSLKITFHRIPKASYNHWAKICNLSDSPSMNKHKKVCSLHFEDACFDRTGQTTRLRDNVIPTLLLPSDCLMQLNVATSTQAPALDLHRSNASVDTLSAIQRSSSICEVETIFKMPSSSCAPLSPSIRPVITVNKSSSEQTSELNVDVCPPSTKTPWPDCNTRVDILPTIQNSSSICKVETIFKMPSSYAAMSPCKRPVITVIKAASELASELDVDIPPTSTKRPWCISSSSDSPFIEDTQIKRIFSIKEHNYVKSPSKQNVQQTHLSKLRMYQRKYYYSKKRICQLKERIKSLKAQTKELQVRLSEKQRCVTVNKNMPIKIRQNV